MSIQNSPDNIQQVFGDSYEAGSDGKPVISQPKPNEKPSGSMENYVGYLVQLNDKVYLKTLGNAKLELDLKTTVDISAFNNKIITVTGAQVDGTIVNAVIIGSVPETAKRKKQDIDTTLKDLANATREFLNQYKPTVKNLLTARPGYKFSNGSITKTHAIVAVVEHKVDLSVLTENERLPDNYKGYDVEVVTASPKNMLRYKLATDNSSLKPLAKKLEISFFESLVTPTETEAALLERGAITINYTPPPNVQLDEVEEAMTLICHVSPEGGWKTLGPFLSDTTEHLQIAMYDFSAPQLFDTLKEVAGNGASLKLVYDGNPASGVGKDNKADDVTEDKIIKGISKIAGSNFEYVKAWKGKGGFCYNAYHIKVAVRDQKSFWLSSGNWQTSNQPNVDFTNNVADIPKYNREWNVVINNTRLAKIFHEFIQWDFQQSQNKPEDALMESFALPQLYISEDFEEVGRSYQLFPPHKFTFAGNNKLRVQPVLTPDNYIEHALKVIRSAKKTLFFQNQYITIPAELTEEYSELLDELAKKTNSTKIDCRIILRKTYSEDDKNEILSNLQAKGFNMSKVKFMANTHTKGIIADGEIIMLGSHNWSGSGVQFNRDASLVIYNAQVAQFYQDVFEHDWQKRTIRERTESEIIPVPSTEAALLESNLVPLDWSEYFD